jgi:uncharacterized lipoprotein
MPHLAKLAAVLVLVSICSGCNSVPQTYEDDWDLKYQHSAEFMWDQVQYALNKHFEVEKADYETRKIETEWNEHLSVMSHHGYRERLLVELKGDEEAGFNVQVKEERQINTEQVNPQASSEAKWEDSEAEGGAVGKFRVALYGRLHPKESWKDEGIR